VNLGDDASARGTHSRDTGKVVSRYPRWLLVAAFFLATTRFVTMLRFAIDLLVVVCVVWLLGWSGHRAWPTGSSGRKRRCGPRRR
jgi:hypothetical protein